MIRRYIKRFTITAAFLVLALVLGVSSASVALAHPPGITARVSVSSAGTDGNQQSERSALSGDGRFVVFVSLADNLVAGDTNNAADIFVHDRLMGTTERVSVASNGGQANADSSFASITPDGRFVAFGSFADNLVAGDTNFTSDVFVRDRQAGTTE